ncbi:MAG TPA: hypothetical protein VKB03_08485 [Conexibacter sp.]|nr:hypothetical protein [Conexibacter sp.]
MPTGVDLDRSAPGASSRSCPAHRAGVVHLRLTTRKDDTFLVVKVANLTAGKLQFKVRATSIGSGAPSVNLTTQVTQSRRR